LRASSSPTPILVVWHLNINFWFGSFRETREKESELKGGNARLSVSSTFERVSIKTGRKIRDSTGRAGSQIMAVTAKPVTTTDYAFPVPSRGRGPIMTRQLIGMGSSVLYSLAAEKPRLTSIESPGYSSRSHHFTCSVVTQTLLSVVGSSLN
jgi:hypothetical protein